MCFKYACISNVKKLQFLSFNRKIYIEAIPYSAGNSGIMISKNISEIIRFSVDNPQPELPPDDKIQKWNTGQITVNTSTRYLSCEECEEDIDEDEHYP